MWYGGIALLARPALLDDLEQLVGDVDAPAVVPAVLEPLRRACRRRRGRARRRSARPACDRPANVRLLLPRKPIVGLIGVRAEEQVELGVQRVAQEQLDDDLPGSELRGQAAQAASSALVGDAERELLAELLGQLLLAAAVRSALSMPSSSMQQAQRLPELVLRAAAASRPAAGSSAPSPPSQRSTRSSICLQPRRLK